MAKQLPKNNRLESVRVEEIRANFSMGGMGIHSIVSICGRDDGQVGDVVIGTMEWNAWSEEAIDALKHLQDVIERDVVRVLTKDNSVVASPPGDIPGYDDDESPGWGGPSDDDDDGGGGWDGGMTFGS